ncbi:uncharacterized protein A4U43_C04F32380 [Asparagus officinalis]|uniref:Uncharacterized protein n=1 Tax=Asparagus officinalis TaxID=4686 RepID=A0A5P1FAG5_ASPOF|nr:uncharacterized protein A4U43_C04F32380 [Asparagus officinalis]
MGCGGGGLSCLAVYRVVVAAVEEAEAVAVAVEVVVEEVVVEEEAAAEGAGVDSSLQLENEKFYACILFL